jgi:hypothetical protein
MCNWAWKFYKEKQLGLKLVFPTNLMINWVSSCLSFFLSASTVATDPSTMANLTLIILFSEMFKFFLKLFSSKSKNILKDNSEYIRIFHLLKWFFKIIYLFIWQTCVEMAKVLQYIFTGPTHTTTITTLEPLCIKCCFSISY